MRWCWLVLLASMAVGCGDDAGDAGGSTSPRGSAIPVGMRALLVARGVPHFYTVIFASDEQGPDGAIQPRPTPRRLDSWSWIDDELVLATFDSGFFVGEERQATALPADLPRPTRSPTDFDAGTTPEDVEAMLGPSFTDETADLEGIDVLVRRYPAGDIQGPIAFAFIDGALTSVTAGYAGVTNDP